MVSYRSELATGLNYNYRYGYPAIGRGRAAVNSDGRESMVSGKVYIRRHGQGSYGSVLVKGLAQEGGLSVWDGKRSLPSMEPGTSSMATADSRLLSV